jgi:hypothetical protein
MGTFTIIRQAVSGQLSAFSFQRQAVSGQPSAVSLRRSAFGGRLSAVSFQRPAFSGELSAASCQRQGVSGKLSAASCQRQAVSGQLSAVSFSAVSFQRPAFSGKQPAFSDKLSAVSPLCPTSPILHGPAKARLLSCYLRPGGGWMLRMYSSCNAWASSCVSALPTSHSSAKSLRRSSGSSHSSIRQCPKPLAKTRNAMAS